eukprot:g77690.t1
MTPLWKYDPASMMAVRGEEQEERAIYLDSGSSKHLVPNASMLKDKADEGLDLRGIDGPTKATVMGKMEFVGMILFPMYGDTPYCNVFVDNVTGLLRSYWCKTQDQNATLEQMKQLQAWVVQAELKTRGALLTLLPPEWKTRETGMVRIWAARGFFEYISGAKYEDCLLWKLTTDDNKCREGALGDVSPCAPGLFILFPAGWRRKTPVQINRGSKRFIFAAREKYLLLIQEANRRKREAKGNSAEPRSSGRPKKLEFGSLEESEEEEQVTTDTKPKTKGKKGSQSKQEKQEKQKPPKETPKGAEESGLSRKEVQGLTLSISRSLFSRTQPDLARFGEVAVEIY